MSSHGFARRLFVERRISRVSARRLIAENGSS
jgi:hypothetical protein